MSFMREITKTTGNNRVGLWRPSFVKVDSRLFVFGGGGNVTSDLHVLDLRNMKWETIQNVKGIPPCKRYGHTSTFWNNCIVIFGGCDEFQNYYNDIHLFDIKSSTWIQPQIEKSVPARYMHSASVYNNKLFIYGGFAKNPECTYVLDDLSVLDLNTFTWAQFHGIPPRYNHSATLIGPKMYIYAGKDQQGNTVTDLFVLHLDTPPYTPRLVLTGQMVLLKSHHYCEAVCGKLVVFGLYNHDAYGLWVLDLDQLEWQRQDCYGSFDIGGWNYFTVMTDTADRVKTKKFLFLGNTDPNRPQGYDHFRDAMVIHSETFGLYDIPQSEHTLEFSSLLNNQEFSDFVIIPSNGQALYVHQVILIARWPHFRNMYKSGMLESEQKRLVVPERYEVMLAFLKYLYSDTLDPEESCAVICDLLALANMYLMTRLKKLCCLTFYRHHLSLQNCAMIFETAMMVEEVGLKSLVLDFMFKHYGQLLKSDVVSSMSSFARQQFLEAVPSEAKLEISHHHHPFHPIPYMSISKHNAKCKISILG
ncbi:hypothetical protein G6F43_010223 [Rhizopus delemar]|nr:hypothetical protein G6F43_010223 [Rhizopus delemar]